MNTLIIISVLACTDSSSETATDTEVVDGEQEVTAALSEVIPTVIDVTWTTTSDEPGTVVWAPEGGAERTTTAALQEDGSWRAFLVGAPQQTAVSWQVRNGALATDGTLTTGEGPSWVPRDPTTSGIPIDGYVVAAMRTTDKIMAYIVDGEGRAVWWYPIDAYGEDALSSRVSLDPNGRGVWFNTIKLRSAPDSADAELGVTLVSWDGTETEYTELPSHHHDFLVHDDGTIAFLSYLPQGDDRELDVLMEMSPDGETTVVWDSDEVLERPDEQTAFLNTIEYVEETDQYWISATELDLLAVVDRSTGELAHTFGGWMSDLDVDDPFEGQHGFDVLGDELLIFDNGNASDGDSRAIRYTIDWEAGTATSTWSHHANPPLYSTFLGDAMELPDGRHLVNWTTHGRVHVVDGDTIDTVWQYDTFEYLTFTRFEETLLP